MARRLIFSDLHFGDPLCSLRRESVSKGLRNFLRDIEIADEVILAGDILDANISSLTLAIEGKKGKSSWPTQLGFRKWLSYIFEGDQFKVNRIVYIPGNHDYIIWNILSTDKAFVAPISEGGIPQNLPLMESVFYSPFIAGVAPERLRNKFIVSYPDYEFDLYRNRVLVTHGHYLDHKQTLFDNLKKLIRKENGNAAKAVRKFFIGTAMYQAAANAISYKKDWRELVDRIHKGVSDFIDVVGVLRNKPIDAELLEAIEMYLRYFRRKQPDIFIFGHTHRAARALNSDFKRTHDKRLIKKIFEIWNDGSFIESRRSNRAGTFTVTDDSDGPERLIKCYRVGLDGTVSELNL